MCACYIRPMNSANEPRTDDPFAHDGFNAGLRAAWPVMLGYLSIGFAAGVVQRAAGLSIAEVMLMSLVLYAGSAQFVAASMIATSVPGAAPVSAIVVTIAFVNLRHLLLSAAIAPALRGVAWWKNALLGAQLTDETFVVAWNHAASRGALRPAWMAGLNLGPYSAWATANLAGALIGNAVTRLDVFGFDFALAAMFAALLTFQLAMQSHRARGVVVAVAAAFIALAGAKLLAGNWNIIVATLAGATFGFALERWKSAPASS